MSLVRGLIKSAIVVKLAQVAQRELSKPENQQKIKEGFEKVKQAAAKRRATPEKVTLIAAPPGLSHPRRALRVAAEPRSKCRGGAAQRLSGC